MMQARTLDIDDQDQDQASRDVAANIYSSLNLLTIKKSVRILCELEEHILEDFVKKYSGLVIFLLNILDTDRSNQLLARLTDASLIYLTEEELRLHLIREVAFVEDPEGVMTLSLFLDTLDRPEAAEQFEETGVVLQYLSDSEHTLKKNHFAYLDTLRGPRTNEILKGMVARNIHVGLGVLIFSSPAVSFEVMDEIAATRPEILAQLPDGLFQARFSEAHDMYLEPALFRMLPAEVQKRVERIQSIQEKYREQLDRVYAYSRQDPKAYRQEIINIVYGILKEIDPQLKVPLLSELEQRGSLAREDIVLLNEFDRG